MPLPASRKLRALIAYLALASHAPTRAQLSELLWTLPDDPRGELRGCLSKARAVLDAPGRPRVISQAAMVRLDLEGVEVDALEVGRATQAGLAAVPVERLRALAGCFGGDFLEGLEIDHSPQFTGWLVAQRRRFRAAHVAVLEALASRLAVENDELLAVLGRWLELAPFDRRAHELMLAALASRGELREGEEHLAAAARSFEAEGLDWRPLGEAWRMSRRKAGSAMAPAPQPAPAPAPGPRRASVAVMPFEAQPPEAAGRGGLADGLVHDVIVRLAKLRMLFVIAQGTTFALRERCMGPEEAGRLLNVDYVASGRLRHTASRLVVEVELVETRSARVVWAEVFDQPLDDAFIVLDAIGHRIVASLAGEIETAERNRARLKPPDSLDAWEAYHRGLWHMYRFRHEDNEQAGRFFERAVQLDPTFARAHAGLSFTHFQRAFQHWGDREAETSRALETAGRSLIVDDRDPAAHWAMGRALWLRGQQEGSLEELETAVSLSPNFALGHYTLAFVHSQSGDPEAAISASDHARHLSPFDPLLFGMLGARAMALVRLRRFEEAAEWAVKAAARPNAHVHILAIAAHCLALAGRLPEARGIASALRRMQPGYGEADFRAAFRFSEEAGAVFGQATRRIGW